MRLAPLFRVLGVTVALIDLILLLAASNIAGIVYHLSFVGGIGEPFIFSTVALAVFCYLTTVLTARGCYRPDRLASISTQLSDLTTTWLLVWFVLFSVIFALKASDALSRAATVAFFVLGWTVLVGWRLICVRFIARAMASGLLAKRKVIVIGDQAELDQSDIAAKLPQWGYLVAATMTLDQSQFSRGRLSPQLRLQLNSMVELSRTQNVAAVVLLMNWSDGHTIQSILDPLRSLPIPVYLAPDQLTGRFFSATTVTIGDATMAELQRAPLNLREQMLKRVFDIGGAGCAALLLLPILTIVALGIWLDTGRPILFVQTRNGFNGRTFRMFKFRTMHVLEDGDRIRQASVRDPRVTRFGRWLRRTSIDELPQLFNVLKGDMSLVGPRPHAVAHNSEYEKVIANYAFRHHVKPGMTGWAQVLGYRGETPTVETMTRRVDADLWYINNWSLRLDLRILFKTAFLGLQQTAY